MAGQKAQITWRWGKALITLLLHLRKVLSCACDTPLNTLRRCCQGVNVKVEGASVTPFEALEDVAKVLANTLRR